MSVRHPLRSIFPTLFVATPLALLVSACAGDGASRPDIASDLTPTVEAVEPSAPASAPGSKHDDEKDNPPTEVARALPPAPYGWRLHRAPRRIGAGVSEGSWRIAGDLGDLSDGLPIVMSAAPMSTSSLIEPLDAAPVAQTVALTAPATSTQPLLDPAPSAAVTPEAAAISVPADPVRASDALVAYAAAAKAAPAKPPTVAPAEPTIVAPAAAAPATPAAADVAAVTSAAPEDAALPVEEEVIDRPEWIINVATHASYEDAQRHMEQLQSTGFKATVRQETVRGRASHRVVIESLPSEAAAKSALANLSKRYGIESAWVMRKR